MYSGLLQYNVEYIHVINSYSTLIHVNYCNLNILLYIYRRRTREGTAKTTSGRYMSNKYVITVCIVL